MTTPNETSTLKLPGLVRSPAYCADCVARLVESIESLDGVRSVIIDDRTATLTVTRDARVLSDAKLREEAHQLGVGIERTISHAAYRISGLD